MLDGCPDTFDFPQLRLELIEDEGNKPAPYKDTVGKLTIGIGHNLSDLGLSPAAIEFIFKEDVARYCRDLDNNIPWWRLMPQRQQRVMLNLCFNLGWGRLSQFRLFLAAMQNARWAAAAGELVNSRWFGQVGLRGPRMIKRLTAPVANGGA